MKTEQQYADAFAEECARYYPEVTAIEQELGYAVPTIRLQAAARTLACPVKVNPPNWQHGRLIYAMMRDLLENEDHAGCFLDIGTAKGFSAVAMTWALMDAGARHDIVSVDAVDPMARVARNSVAEVNGELFTVQEFVSPFLPEGAHIHFHGGGSLPLLDRMIGSGERVRFAFVDGKHNFAAVSAEILCLTRLQSPGDAILFDDVQIPGVAEAVMTLRGYSVRPVRAGPRREYAMAVKK